jgi:type I restriction enzyme R subunit
MNKPLTELDLQDLEKLFLDFGIGDEDLLKRASEQSHGLGLFIRSLVGLDKSAAQGVFSEFIDGQKLSANQLKFISLIIDYLSERGVVPVEALYQSPFTNLAPQGPDSIFKEDEVSQIVELLHIVQSRAS